MLGYGLDGIVGLGFTALSDVDYALNETSSDAGRSLLYNLFTLNPSELNFLAFSLLRSTDPDDEVEGSFSIGKACHDQVFGMHPLNFCEMISGEYEPQYASVANTSRISTWPVSSPKRWTLLLDSVIIGTDVVVPTTQVVGAPTNKAVILMDSGASYTWVNWWMSLLSWQVIVTGTVMPRNPSLMLFTQTLLVLNLTRKATNGWSHATMRWTWLSRLGPSSQTLSSGAPLKAISSGQIFPLHPLDVTPTTAGNSSTCVGSFIPTQFGPQTQLWDPIHLIAELLSDHVFSDWLVGDNFLRSVYAVYDFGDYDAKGSMGDPYIQFLSVIDPDEASDDFHKHRGGQPNQNITYVGLSGAAIAPSFFISDDVSETIALVGKLVPTMLGIIALNTIILVVLLAGGLCFWVKRRRSRRSEGTRIPRETRGRMTPMALDGYGFPREQSATPAAYQPVSMALTEDTFVPPLPAFHQFDGVTHPGDRPKSIAWWLSYLICLHRSLFFYRLTWLFHLCHLSRPRSYLHHPSIGLRLPAMSTAFAYHFSISVFIWDTYSIFMVIAVTISMLSLLTMFGGKC